MRTPKKTPDAKRVEAKERFLEKLREVGSVYHASLHADVGRATVYQWRDADPEFAKAWDIAISDNLDTLEKSLFQRAVEGVEEPVFYKGDECGRIRRYSDTAAIFLLKGGRPEKFRERLEHTGKDGGPISVTGLRVEVIQSNAK